MTTKKKPLAEALLDAQVEWVVEQTSGPALKAWLERELDAGLAAAGKLTLNEVTTRQAIKDTARTYAAEVEFGAGIPELVAEVARALHAHGAHDKTRLGDIVSDRRVAETLDQALDLEALRGRMLEEVAASPLYSDFVSDLLYNGIKGYLSENALTRNIPGASSVLKLGKSVISKATPRLEASIEENLKKYIARSVQKTSQGGLRFFMEHADSDTLREAALDLWAKLKKVRISSLRDDVGADELEAMFVNGYEFWRELRKTPYYSGLIDAGIDAVFDKYGETDLAALLEDFGITRDLMLAEALRHAPPAIKALKKHKLLEPLVRRNLEPFFASSVVGRLLAE